MDAWRAKLLAPLPALPLGALVTAVLLLRDLGDLPPLAARRPVSRFGGVTGDVFGAAMEPALATTLLAWSWV